MNTACPWWGKQCFDTTFTSWCQQTTKVATMYIPSLELCYMTGCKEGNMLIVQQLCGYSTSALQCEATCSINHLYISTINYCFLFLLCNSYIIFVIFPQTNLWRFFPHRKCSISAKIADWIFFGFNLKFLHLTDLTDLDTVVLSNLSLSHLI